MFLQNPITIVRIGYCIPQNPNTTVTVRFILEPFSPQPSGLRRCCKKFRFRWRTRTSHHSGSGGSSLLEPTALSGNRDHLGVLTGVVRRVIAIGFRKHQAACPQGYNDERLPQSFSSSREADLRHLLVHQFQRPPVEISSRISIPTRPRFPVTVHWCLCCFRCWLEGYRKGSMHRDRRHRNLKP